MIASGFKTCLCFQSLHSNTAFDITRFQFRNESRIEFDDKNTLGGPVGKLNFGSCGGTNCGTTNLAVVKCRSRKDRGVISHRVGAFGCYIVCALLFQRFLENDHHVSAHAGLTGLLLLRLGDGGTISGGAVRCSARVHASRNALSILHKLRATEAT